MFLIPKLWQYGISNNQNESSSGNFLNSKPAQPLQSPRYTVVEDMEWQKKECLSIEGQTKSMDETSDNVTVRSGHAAAVVGDSMFVFGGWNGAVFLNDIWALDLVNLQWREVVPTSKVLPQARYAHTANVIHPNKILIFGGYGANSTRFNDVFIFDTVKHEWTEIQVSGDIPSPRLGHTALVANLNLDLVNTVNNSEDMMDIDQGAGSIQARMHRQRGKPANMASHLIVFGGKDSSTTYSNDIFALDLKTFVWRLVKAANRNVDDLPAKRHGHSCCICESKKPNSAGSMLIFSGHGMTNNGQMVYLKDCYRFDLDTLIWKEVPTVGMAPIARRNHTAVAFGDRILVFGGYSGIRQRFNDLYVLDAKTCQWSYVEPQSSEREEHIEAEEAEQPTKIMRMSSDSNQASTTGATEQTHEDSQITKRRYHTACAWKDKMVVFGGYDGEKFLNDIYFLETKYQIPTLTENLGDMVEVVDIPFGSPRRPQIKRKNSISGDSGIVIIEERQFVDLIVEDEQNRAIVPLHKAIIDARFYF